MNSNIAEIFQRLHEHYDQKGDTYRARAYATAAAKIRNHPEEIKSGNQAREIRGVGESIASKIDEYLKTGTLEIFQQLTEPEPEAKPEQPILDVFKQIYGVGPKTAEKWYQQGYRKIEDLVDIKMTSAQSLGFKYYYHLQERIPRAEMDVIAAHLKHVFDHYNIEFEICGSYRRGEASSGDVDCLIKGQPGLNLADIVKVLETYGLLIGTFSLGKSKYLGLCRLSPEHIVRRIDLMIVSPKSWPYARLYFTGSQHLNIEMRDRAIALGMTLNEYALTDINSGDQKEATTEAEIFEHLGMDYLAPTERSIGTK